MILRLKGFELEIQMDMDTTSVLTIQNKMLFRSVLKDIFDAIAGIEGNEVVIEENGEMIKFSKNVICIIDYFNLNFQDKQILTGCYKKLADILKHDFDLNQKCNYEIFKLGKLLNELTLDLEFEMTYNLEINIASLLKLYNFQIEIGVQTSVLDRLLLLMIDIYSYFNLCDIMIFVNSKSFFSQQEIIELYKHLKYKKMNFLCIETDIYDKIEGENHYLIDYDLIEFAYSE